MLKNILITCETNRQNELKELFSKNSFNCLSFPVVDLKLNLEALDKYLSKIQDYNWLILTSKNAAQFLFDRLDDLNLDKQSLQNVKIAAIGDKTQQYIKYRGFDVDFVPTKFIAESFVDEFLKLYNLNGQKFFLPKSKNSRDFIELNLVKNNASVDVCHLYESVLSGDLTYKTRELSTILSKYNIDVIVFLSSTAVNNFYKIINNANITLCEILIACIGQQTLRDAKLYFETAKFLCPDRFTIENLANEIVLYFKNENNV